MKTRFAAGCALSLFFALAACATPVEPEGKIEARYDNVVLVKFHSDG